MDAEQVTALSRTLVSLHAAAICSHLDFAGEDDEMAADNRYREAFWRVHVLLVRLRGHLRAAAFLQHA